MYYFILLLISLCAKCRSVDRIRGAGDQPVCRAETQTGVTIVARSIESDASVAVPINKVCADKPLVLCMATDASQIQGQRWAG